jgi:hypothetical protein
MQPPWSNPIAHLSICRGRDHNVPSTPRVPAASFDFDDVLDVPTLHGTLQPRESPFCQHNNFGGGFVSELDRVAISSIHFGSPTSSGATDRCRPRKVHNTSLMGDPDDVRLPRLRRPAWCLHASVCTAVSDTHGASAPAANSWCARAMPM